MYNESYENQFGEMLIKGKVLFSDILFLEKGSMNAAFIARKMNWMDMFAQINIILGTLAKTEIVYPKNVGALVAMNST